MEDPSRIFSIVGTASGTTSSGPCSDEPSCDGKFSESEEIEPAGAVTDCPSCCDWDFGLALAKLSLDCFMDPQHSLS